MMLDFPSDHVRIARKATLIMLIICLRLVTLNCFTLIFVFKSKKLDTKPIKDGRSLNYRVLYYKRNK